ncbi:MAG: hypothetical protein JWM82_3862, partial [Myxococcales bacterium]|nr:hypothetical protein [Myxococcales bacterium]
GAGGGGAGGSTMSGTSGSSGKICLGDQQIDCVPVATCGLETVAIAKLPPEILIVFDKSVSMKDPATGGSCGMPTPCGSKMTEMVNAVSTVVMQTQTSIDWGLKLFADMGACGVAVGPTVPVAPMNGAAISQALSTAAADSHTPTRAGVQAAVAYLMTLTTPNPKFILLATDGIPNCIPNDKNQINYDQAGATQAVTDAVTAGFPVFVLGVGSGVTSNPKDGPIFDPTLTMLATAGGKPRAGTPNYYHASSNADVVAALGTIQSQVGSCVFNLGKVPPDPTNIAVRGDNNVHIPKDPTHMNGWDYAAADMKSVKLYGTWCDQVTMGTLKSVQAIFGCPMVIIP